MVKQLLRYSFFSYVLGMALIPLAGLFRPETYGEDPGRMILQFIGLLVFFGVFMYPVIVILTYVLLRFPKFSSLYRFFRSIWGFIVPICIMLMWLIISATCSFNSNDFFVNILFGAIVLVSISINLRFLEKQRLKNQS